MITSTFEKSKEATKRRPTIEYIRSIDKYKNISQEEYEELIDSLEQFAMIILDCYFSMSEEERAKL
ncbi:hypothetical protein [Parvicella tangerina]|uniref:Uncharacterized protein n=1 Tax=Parvicella tangerina TaxID=2829795 RepID=A0A916JNM9_9FLAO|nr:hypothetical protein [Parvicella tangerina]CAG5085032.1 hypothetical protein CRYO30217_02630 [Parvicella tangerina]